MENRQHRIRKRGRRRAGLEPHGHTVRTATLGEPEHRLTEAVLDETDVLTWWGHEAHDEVDDEVVDRVVSHVRDGMGFIVLHSAHMAKPFIRLMGTPGALKRRQAAERERLWTVAPNHPIVEGIDEYIELPETEMYGEYFDIPDPGLARVRQLVRRRECVPERLLLSARQGNVFYFGPGHETHPIFKQPDVQRVLHNAVEWAAPVVGPDLEIWERPNPLEPIGRADQRE